MANVIFDSNSRVYLSNATDATGSTVIGYQAGASIGDGDDFNVFIGHQVADASMTNATKNVGVGYQALSALAQGDKNIAIGYNSSVALDDGTDNVTIGNQAGDSLTSGSGNVAIGADALGASTDVDRAIVIGADAGGADMTSAADGTIAIGFAAGAAITSGAGNTAIGYKAGEDITDADYNTLIGYEAGANIISGHSNICIGREAGKSLDNSDHNIAIGRDAMNDSTHDDSKYNIGIGSYTLDAIGGNLAEKNIAIGYQAGSGITTGDDNTIVGYRAGQVTTELAGGIDNTLIGSGAITSAPGGNNQTVVGAHTSGQADNSVTLGNASVTAVYAAQDKDAIVYCGGIQFDDAGEQLDDYEEGTWQPAFSTGGGTITAHASASLGSYTKIGNICHVQAHIQVSSISTSPYPSGAARITGLPFTIDNNTGGEDSSVATGTVWVHGMSGALNVLQIAGQAHTSQVIVSEMDGENNSDDASSHLGDTNLQLRIAMIIKCA